MIKYKLIKYKFDNIKEIQIQNSYDQLMGLKIDHFKIIKIASKDACYLVDKYIFQCKTTYSLEIPYMLICEL